MRCRCVRQRPTHLFGAAVQRWFVLAGPFLLYYGSPEDQVAQSTIADAVSLHATPRRPQTREPEAPQPQSPKALASLK